MHDLSLYEVDRSYYMVTGTWHAQDDFEPTGFSETRHKETLRIIAPSEELARAFIESLHRSGFTDGAKVSIDAIRCFRLDGMLTQVF